MLSAAGLVKKALQKLYDSKCDIYIWAPYEKPNKTTGHREELKRGNIPCRRSYSSIPASSEDGKTTRKQQIVKLFLDTNVDVPAGSKIVVTYNAETIAYKKSGEAAVHTNHQEITLELFERYT